MYYFIFRLYFKFIYLLFIYNYNCNVFIVGKLSIIISTEMFSYFQASFLNKKLTIHEKKVNLAIWDTAGQEKFHALGPIYYRMSNGAIIVYDVTDYDTFLRVKKFKEIYYSIYLYPILTFISQVINWVTELRKMLGSGICLAIAGNKIDLEKDRRVYIEEAEE